MQEAVNNFSGGLIKDLNPLTTPNNVLTSCVNGTFITFNGNELVLQNDMGNTLINYEDPVKLSDGFYPIGIKEYGGVLYIVSGKDISKLLLEYSSTTIYKKGDYVIYGETSPKIYKSLIDNNTSILSSSNWDDLGDLETAKSSENRIEFGSFPSPIIDSNSTPTTTACIFNNINEEQVLSEKIFRSGGWVLFDGSSAEENLFSKYNVNTHKVEDKLYTFKLYHKLDKGNIDITNDVTTKSNIDYWFTNSTYEYHCNSRYKGRLAAKVVITPIKFSFIDTHIELYYGKNINLNVPTVETKTATNETNQGFTSGGDNITNILNTITEQCILLNTVNDFDINTAGNLRFNPSTISTPSYTITPTLLPPNTGYYYRAAVYNGTYWGYGKVKQTATLTADISLVTGQPTDIGDSYCNIPIDLSGSDHTVIFKEIGVLVGEATTPTIENSTKFGNQYGFALIPPYTISQQVNGLSIETTYYARSYAYIRNTLYYGDTITFNTLNPPPMITAFTAVKQLDTTIKCDATYSQSGNVTVTSKGFIWGDFDPDTLTTTLYTGKQIVAGVSTSFSYNIPASSNHYYVKAFVTNSDNTTTYSDVKGWGIPWFSNDSIIHTFNTGITLTHEILYDGGVPVVDRGFEIAFELPDTNTVAPELFLCNTGGIGTFSYTYTGHYFYSGVRMTVRSYAINNEGFSNYSYPELIIDII